MISSVNAEDYNLLNTQIHSQADKPTVFQVAWPYVVTTLLGQAALTIVALKITGLTLPIIALMGAVGQMTFMSVLLGFYVKNSDEFKQLIPITLRVSALVGLVDSFGWVLVRVVFNLCGIGVVIFKKIQG